ncbi:hypothetical protein OUZ56_028383 [Daphnia magna]|uniref:Uncharacterized protein n=1 Tax=Daphnia magna TaxID=35525 RepID=A0ABR0B3P6_9CRUS|nr:hypothetical protein OUZ56_028383 [Daphnia magna]
MRRKSETFDVHQMGFIEYYNLFPDERALRDAYLDFSDHFCCIYSPCADMDSISMMMACVGYRATGRLLLEN